MAGAGLALMAGMSGCGSDSGTQPLNLAAGPSTVPPPATPTADGGVALQSLTVTAQQLGSGWTSQDVEQGDQVDGQITLDLCGETFPSEQLRTARHQVYLIPAGANEDSDSTLSNEVVDYSTGGAQQARSELLNAVANCPKTPVHLLMDTTDELVQAKATLLPTNPAWLPGSIAIRSIITTPDGQKQDSVAVYQFQGDILSGVYGTSVDGRPGPDQLKAAASAATLLKGAGSSAG